MILQKTRAIHYLICILGVYVGNGVAFVIGKFDVKIVTMHFLRDIGHIKTNTDILVRVMGETQRCDKYVILNRNNHAHHYCLKETGISLIL